MKTDMNFDLVGLGTKSDRALAAELGVPFDKVYMARRKRGIPSFQEQDNLKWDTLPLGKISDMGLAIQEGCTRETVRLQRKKRNIPKFDKTRRQKLDIDWEKQPLGKVSDSALAVKLGCTTKTVGEHRRKLGILPVVEHTQPKAYIKQSFCCPKCGGKKYIPHDDLLECHSCKSICKIEFSLQFKMSDVELLESLDRTIKEYQDIQTR